MLPKLQEVYLRHATYFVRLAQEHRNSLSQIDDDLVNIMRAADFCIQRPEWNLLASLTDAINEYLLRNRWPDYIKINTPLVTNDLAEQPEARIKRVLQLIELEENRCNYPKALDWNKFLVELHQSDKDQNTGEVIRALKQMAKLSERRGEENEAMDHLMRGLELAYEIDDTKNKIDIMFEIALLHKRQEHLEAARRFCDAALNAARGIGYSLAELDIITLNASLYVKDDPDHALGLYREAIALAKTRQDVQRCATIQLELDKLIAIERGKKKRDVFISYSHHDRKFVEQLAADLRMRGFPVWWDAWEIRVGDSIIQRISEGIDGSAYLIAVLSPHSVESAFFLREINSALNIQLGPGKKIVVLPLVVSDCEIPIFLRDIKWADFRNDYGQGFKSLTERLENEVLS